MEPLFRPYTPDQHHLLPPSLRDWLAEDHMAYFISDTVDGLCPLTRWTHPQEYQRPSIAPGGQRQGQGAAIGPSAGELRGAKCRLYPGCPGGRAWTARVVSVR